MMKKQVSCSNKFQWKKDDYSLLAFLLITIALLIGVSIYCYQIKQQSKQKHLWYFGLWHLIQNFDRCKNHCVSGSIMQRWFIRVYDGTRYLVLFSPEKMMPFTIGLDILWVKKVVLLMLFLIIMQESKLIRLILYL